MNCADAASIPATADRIAAKPQPIESIHGTRTPSSLLAEGSTAEARSASPSFVNLKSSHSDAHAHEHDDQVVDRLLRDRDVAD